MSNWREDPNLVLENEAAYNEFIEEINSRITTENWESGSDLKKALERYLKPTESTDLEVTKTGLQYAVTYRGNTWHFEDDFVRRLRINNISDDENEMIQSIKNYIKVQEVGVW